MGENPAPDSNLWTELAPHLDQALQRLSESDRQVILHRFFRRESLREVGRRLGISEDAAGMRVGRGLDRSGQCGWWEMPHPGLFPTLQGNLLLCCVRQIKASCGKTLLTYCTSLAFRRHPFVALRRRYRQTRPPLMPRVSLTPKLHGRRP